MRTEFLCISVLRVASGPRMKLASYKSALNPTVVYSTDRSKAVVPVLVLLFYALWFAMCIDIIKIWFRIFICPLILSRSGLGLLSVPPSFSFQTFSQ